MDLQVGVKILLRNPEGKYFLVERSDKKYPEAAGTWDIVGGRINPGTTLLENLTREVAEETKLQIHGEPRLIAAQDILRIAGRHVVRLTYVGETQGEPVLDHEAKNFGWFTLEELKRHPNLDMYVSELADKGILEGL